MGYWKTKVLPKIQKVFGKDAVKKAAAEEACKSFDENREELSKEFEEKKIDLQPKVQEIYEASSTEIKTLVKDSKEADLKKHSVKIQTFLDELVKIEFPGSKPVCEACSKFGPALIPGPLLYLFEKVSTVIVTEEKPREVGVPPTQEETTTTQQPSEVVEKQIVATEEKPSEAAAEVTPVVTVNPVTGEPPKEDKPQLEVPPPTKPEQPTA